MSEAPSAQTVVRAGTVVSAGRYIVLEKVGRGGMGEVWRARDAVLKRDVAIKVMPSGSRPALKEYFEREALAMARVKSEHVVEIHDVGRLEGEDTSSFLVMELVEPGTTLAALKSELANDPVRAVRLFVQATEGLAAIHRRGIVHRDVKPANLLVAHRHETGRSVLKVADFGVALYPEDPADAQPAVGTMGYAAPEQMRLETVDARADVYALGVTMYEVLTGRRPHTRDEIVAWWRERHAPEGYLQPLPEPVPACERNAQVPEELARVVHACLAHAIERRPRSMGALRFSLEDVLQRVLGVPLAERSGPPCNEAAVDARKQLADLAEAMVVDGTILDSERTFLVERALALGIAPEAAGPLVEELFAEAWRRRRSEAATVLANE